MGIPEYTPAQDKLVVRRIDALVREEEYYLDHRDEPFALSAAESARNLASALEALRAELATERSSREESGASLGDPVREASNRDDQGLGGERRITGRVRLSPAYSVIPKLNSE